MLDQTDSVLTGRFTFPDPGDGTRASWSLAGGRGLVGRGITWSKMREGGWRLGGTLPGTISEEDFTSCVMDHGALSSAPRREGIFWPLPEE